MTNNQHPVIQNASQVIEMRDPASLLAHPLLAKLYLPLEEGEFEPRPMTPEEATNAVLERMDVSDLIESIRESYSLQWREPLIGIGKNIIVSGGRRLVASIKLGMKEVPVIFRSFTDDLDLQQAILDLNTQRIKTFSQTAREITLQKEIVSAKAKQRRLSGKKDPPDPGEGKELPPHARETNSIIAARLGMGAEKLREIGKIIEKAKAGDPKAVQLIKKLDEKQISVDAAYKALNNHPEALVSRWQKAEPISKGTVCTCLDCGKDFHLLHLKNGDHKIVQYIPDEITTRSVSEASAHSPIESEEFEEAK